MSFFADFGGMAIGFLGAGLAACLCGAGSARALLQAELKA